MSAERTFLHDISSPLTSVLLNMDNVILMLQDRKLENLDECIKILNSCMVQVKRSTDLIHSRREVLIEESDK